MRRPLILFSFVLLWNITNPGVFAKSGPGVNPALYKALEWRSMGPYRRGLENREFGTYMEQHFRRVLQDRLCRGSSRIIVRSECGLRWHGGISDSESDLLAW